MEQEILDPRHVTEDHSVCVFVSGWGEALREGLTRAGRGQNAAF